MIDAISLFITNYFPMQKVLYFNNLFYINDLYKGTNWGQKLG